MASLILITLLGLVTSSLSAPQGSDVGPQVEDSPCDLGYECVPWQQCIEGFVSFNEGKVIDERTKPANYDAFRCGLEGNMCCSLLPPDLSDLISSGFIEGEGTKGELKNQCGHASYACVPYFLCVDGIINTDGAGLLNVRVKPQGVCENPEHIGVPGVCCLIPGKVPTPSPIDLCPESLECVDYSLCSKDGRIVTDGTGIIDIRTGHTSCKLPSGISGICCSPPSQNIDVCPGDSVCTSVIDCLGQALDVSNNFVDYAQRGAWTQCPYSSGDGVCCIPSTSKVIDTCPGKSVCVPQNECVGTALDINNAFVDFTSQGAWSYCSKHKEGVCCLSSFTSILEPAPKCGIRNYHIDTRITSKIDAAFGEFPWQSIIFYQNYTFNCGASLISNKHVVTAAHCVQKLLPGDIRIRFGEWQVNSFDEELPYVDRNVNAIHIHPKFNADNLHNDIAILELYEPIDFQYHINSICIPKEGHIFDPFTICIASGWGKDSFTGSFQHILKSIALPYVDHDNCQNLLRKTRLGKYFKLDKSFICAGGEENKDACYGDGGGPLVCKDKISSQYVLAGITAWGIGCGTKNIPGVYVDVQRFNKWIEKIVVVPGSSQQELGTYRK